MNITPHQATRAPNALQLTLLLAAVLLPLLSCGGAKAQRGGLELPDRFEVLYRENGSESRDTIDVPVDEVWRRLPAAYKWIGLPAAGRKKGEEWEFFTPHLELRGKPLYARERNSDYIRCGAGVGGRDRSDEYHVTFMVLTRIRAHGAGATVVETLVDGHARPASASSGSVPCTGTGKLEKQILEVLKRRG